MQTEGAVVLRTIIGKFKKDYAAAVLFALCAALFLLFLRLFSFSILQSDDYYYASFWKDGIASFIRLTCDHFQNFNGRALVHFFAQTVLYFPQAVRAAVSSVILLGICLLSCGYFRIFKLGEKDSALFLSLLYMLMMMLGVSQMKEALLWYSAFFNYLFPALLALSALLLYELGSTAAYPLCFLAGATTEQWGAAALSMLLFAALDLFLSYIRSSPRTKKGNFKKGAFSPRILARYFAPPILSLLGYATIYLSPATRGRLVLSEPSFLTLKSDFFSLSEVFISEGRTLIIPIVFICAVMSLALLKKRQYYFLLFGFIPIGLLTAAAVSGFNTAVSAASLLALLCYMVLAFIILFFFSPLKKTAVMIMGSFVSAIIMLPTATFEARISFPMALLSAIAALSVFTVTINEQPFIRMRKSIIYPALSLAVLVIASALFAPSYAGFKYNHTIETENLSAIREAHKTKVLHYNIDYDKKYAMRQMFNDGWFYNEFVSLYDLSDCEIVFESGILSRVCCRGKDTSAVAPEEGGKKFIPVRAALSALGGDVTVSENGDVTMTLYDYVMTLSDGILTYRDSDGVTHYEVADDHKSLSFYTLSLDKEILEDAFGLKITETDGRININ